jgi:hypothetical protein
MARGFTPEPARSMPDANQRSAQFVFLKPAHHSQRHRMQWISIDRRPWRARAQQQNPHWHAKPSSSGGLSERIIDTETSVAMA